MMVYYAIFQLLDNWMKAGSAYNTPNRTITSLSTEYDVNIRTFRRNSRPLGFCWFNSIWINENVFKNKKRLLFVFFHEYYHLTHKHKMKNLLLRLLISLTPLTLMWVKWYFFLILLLSVAIGIHFISNEYFEKKANEYAAKMLKNE